MPNRVIREGILDSDRVNALSWQGEVFYRRLHSIVDDYGCYDARSPVLRSKLFPLRLEKVSISDIEKMMRECVDAALVRCYTVSGKNYLEVINFNQTVRIKKRKFPPPEGNAPQMQADASRCVPETNPNQSGFGFETGLESETETNPEGADAVFLFFIENFNKITSKNFSGSKNTRKELDLRINEGFKIEQIIDAVKKCFGDKFHQDNPNHLTPDFILKLEKLEKYINYQAPRDSSSGNKNMIDYWDKKFYEGLSEQDRSKYHKILHDNGFKPVKKKINGIEKLIEFTKLSVA